MLGFLGFSKLLLRSTWCHLSPNLYFSLCTVYSVKTILVYTIQCIFSLFLEKDVTANRLP